MDGEDEAAEEVSRQDRLLPGERSAMRSDDIRDAEVWMRVYAELAGFKHALLAQIADQRTAVESRGQAEVDNDTELLEREAERLRRRLRFWESELARREA